MLRLLKRNKSIFVLLAYKSYEGWVVSNGYDVREERFWVMQAACINFWYQSSALLKLKRCLFSE